MNCRSLTVGCLVAVIGVLAAPPARAEGDAAVRRAVDAYLADADHDFAPAGRARFLAAAAEEPAEPWTFTAAIYLWATSIDGDIDARGNSTSIDVPFSDIFDDLSGAFMGRFGARTGKWGIVLDVIWCDLEDSTTGPLGGTVSSTLQMFIAELTGSYAVLERGEIEQGLFTLDAYAGARVYSVDVELTTTLANPEQSETWVDPIVGFGARYRTSRWAFDLRADIGGFGISSELAWSVTATVAYRCTRIFWLAAGYRLLDIDFESGDSPFVDVQLSGPFFALVFNW